MNAEAFRAVIRDRLQGLGHASAVGPASPGAAEGETPGSLAETVRALQAEFLAARRHVPPPPLPMPSAEQVAAFVEGGLSEPEEASVIAACLHDPGMLLQLLIAEQAWATAEGRGALCPAPSTDLRRRLLAIGGPRVTAHTAATGHESCVPAAGNQPTTGRATTTGRAPAGPGEAAVRWALIGALAASLVWGVGWWIRGDRRGSPDAERPIARAEPRGDRRPPANDVATADSGADMQAQAFRGDVRDRMGDETAGSVRDAVEDDRTASGQETSLQESSADRSLSPSTRSMPSVSRSDFSGRGDRAPDASTEPAGARSTPTGPSDSSVTRAGDGPTADRGRMKGASAGPGLVWTEIVGLVAEQTEAGYDRWRAISEVEPTARVSTDDFAGQAVRQGDGTSPVRLLMLAGCYARGSVRFGGEFVLAEETRVSIESGPEGTLRWTLETGSIAFRGMPPGTRFRIDDSDGRMLEVVSRTESDFRCWMEDGELHLAVSHGEIATPEVSYEQRPQAIRSGRRQRLVDSGLADGGADDGPPVWVETLPTDRILSRSVLANLRGSDDLQSALDRTLVSLVGNGRSAGARRRVQEIELLSRWRGGIAVEDPLEAATHPLLSVRAPQLQRLLSPRDGSPFDSARRMYAAQLSAGQVGPGRASPLAGWLAAWQGRQPPGRTEFALWLRQLEDDDPLVAATADFLLRRFAGQGPVFDPRAPRPLRTLARRQWAPLVTSAISSRGRVP